MTATPTTPAGLDGSRLALSIAEAAKAVGLCLVRLVSLALQPLHGRYDAEAVSVSDAQALGKDP